MRSTSSRALAILFTVGAVLGCAGGITPSATTEPDDHDHDHTQVPRRFFPEGAGAPLFNDLGSHDRAITTESELASRYFEQGLILAYGFNHAEAQRSFKEASRQDPSCAICAWGEAYVLGPNINKPMDVADVPAAYEATQRALALIDTASAVERALIDALSTRYGAEPVPDRASLDRDYAEAMREVAREFPDDLDAQTLFAEALMDTMPWDYYVSPKQPKPETLELVATLESVIQRNPDHVGALHLYIHVIEPSTRPERAEPAADRLGPLAPGAGHLVHMPSHIYLRVGRYHDASIANEKAAAADESYISQCRVQGYYPASYYPHNVHFLYTSSAFEGRSAVSIEAARKLSSNMTPEIVAEVPISEEFVPMDLFALARFGRWREILRTEAPNEEWRYATGVWHYVRGMAHAAKGDAEDAEGELAVLRQIAAEPGLGKLTFASGSTPRQLLSIGALVLEARIAGEAGRWADAIPLLRKAVKQQDALPYTEPPPWYFPVREALGHALLEAGQPAKAEAVFRKQLEYTPRNGWSLFGLAESQRAQDENEAAKATEAQLAEVFERADISLRASVF